MKKMMMSALAVLAMLATGPTVASSGEPPFPTEAFTTIVRYYNQSGELIGWDIYYCDFTVESYREFGEVEWSLTFQDGFCFG